MAPTFRIALHRGSEQYFALKASSSLTPDCFSLHPACIGIVGAGRQPNRKPSLDDSLNHLLGPWRRRFGLLHGSAEPLPSVPPALSETPEAGCGGHAVRLICAACEGMEAAAASAVGAVGVPSKPGVGLLGQNRRRNPGYGGNGPRPVGTLDQARELSPAAPVSPVLACWGGRPVAGRFEAIIDSGASRCLFHSDLAAYLGIDPA